MEYLDSLDLDVSQKSKRVRSWYLYEQFKSLERNQLDAARELKDRSCQDRILRQELSERKARRNVYDQISLSRSTSRVDSVRSESEKSSIDTCCADAELNSFQYEDLVQDLDSEDSQTNQYDTYNDQYKDNFKSFEEQSNHSSPDSITSVVDAKSDETFTNEKDITHKMILDFEEVKEKLQSIEKLTKMREENCPLIDENDEKEIISNDNNIQNEKHMDTTENNLIMMWSKLVSFAYQLMQLNHGNCYSDYGSQLLTAVLACDVLRRGINRMCYILQPYVSPIKFATDSVSSVETHENFKRKKQNQIKSCKYKYRHSKTRTKHIQARKNRSDFWGFMPSQCQDIGINHRYHSEPWDKYHESERGNTKSSYHSIRPLLKETPSSNKLLREEFCKCGRRKTIINPMLRLSQYLDSIMKDIEEPLF